MLPPIDKNQPQSEYNGSTQRQTNLNQVIMDQPQSGYKDATQRQNQPQSGYTSAPQTQKPTSIKL